MKRKELTNTFMMIKIENNPLVHGLYKHISVL